MHPVHIMDSPEAKAARNKAERKQEEKDFQRNIAALERQKDLSSLVQGMKVHATNPEIQKQVCLALCTFDGPASSNDTNQVEITRYGGIDAVIKALVNHGDHSGVAEFALASLSNLINHPFNKSKIAIHMALFLKILVRHHNNAGVQRNGCLALWNLGQPREPPNDANYQLEIAEHGGLAVICNAILAHRNNPGVQEHGCRALWVLSVGNIANKLEIEQRGGLEAVLYALEHRDDEEVQESACGALACLLALPRQREYDDVRVKVAKLGGITSVILSLTKHRTNAKIQEQGCTVLCNLAAGVSVAGCIVEITRAGGIDCVVKAMNNHPNDLNIQQICCAVLRNLANDATNREVEIARIGGIRAVVNAMMKHRNHATVQHYGCSVLCILALDAANKVEIAKRGGIRAVVNAGVNHRTNASIQEECCRALKFLASNNEANQVEIARLLDQEPS
jgi:hypothetical protein